MSFEVEAPECLTLPIQVPSKLLMGAGPSNASESVLNAGSLPLLGHLHTEFIKVYIIINELLHFIFNSILIDYSDHG